MTVREVLHAHIPTLTERSTVRDAIDKMDIYQFPALVLVDETMRPTHVITEGDIVRAVQRKGSLVGLAGDKVCDFATQEPTTMPPTTEISDALYHMLQSGLTVLPVVEEDILLGIVLRVDLMQALLMDAASHPLS